MLLELAIRNLINNAIDAMELDKSSEPRITIQISKIKDHIELRIYDNGPGVPKELQGRIFEPFYSTKPDGTGTGLCLIQRLSEHYDIQVFYDNCLHDKRGACFCLRLKHYLDK